VKKVGFEELQLGLLTLLQHPVAVLFAQRIGLNPAVEDLGVVPETVADAIKRKAADPPGADQEVPAADRKLALAGVPGNGPTIESDVGKNAVAARDGELGPIGPWHLRAVHVLEPSLEPETTVARVDALHSSRGSLLASGFNRWRLGPAGSHENTTKDQPTRHIKLSELSTAFPGSLQPRRVAKEHVQALTSHVLRARSARMTSRIWILSALLLAFALGVSCGSSTDGIAEKKCLNCADCCTSNDDCEQGEYCAGEGAT
jgi:hypothetical protein